MRKIGKRNRQPSNQIIILLDVHKRHSSISTAYQLEPIIKSKYRIQCIQALHSTSNVGNEKNLCVHGKKQGRPLCKKYLISIEHTWIYARNFKLDCFNSRLKLTERVYAKLGIDAPRKTSSRSRTTYSSSQSSSSFSSAPSLSIRIMAPFSVWLFCSCRVTMSEDRFMTTTNYLLEHYKCTNEKGTYAIPVTCELTSYRRFSNSAVRLSWASCSRRSSSMKWSIFQVIPWSLSLVRPSCLWSNHQVIVPHHKHGSPKRKRTTGIMMSLSKIPSDENWWKNKYIGKQPEIS